MKRSGKLLFLLAVGSLLAACGEPTPSEQSSPTETAPSTSEQGPAETSPDTSTSEEAPLETMPIADFRAAETGVEATLKGIVVGHRYNGQGTPYITGFYLTDGEDTIYVYGEDTAKKVKVGEEVVVKGAKTYYMPKADQGAAAALGYKGQAQLENAELVSQDGETHEVPASAIAESTCAKIAETPLTTDISGKLYRIKGYYDVKEGGTASDQYTNYSLYDLNRVSSLFHYSTSSGKDFAWTKEYDGKAIDMLVTAVLAKPSSGGWRFAPISVYGEVTVAANEEAGYAMDRLLEEIPLEHESAVELHLPTNDKFVAEITREVTSADPKVEIAKDEATKETIVRIPANATGKHALDLKVTYGAEVVEKTVELTISSKVAVETITIAEAIASADKTEVAVEATVVGAITKSGKNLSVYLADETGSIRVYASAAYQDAIADLKQGNRCIVKGIKDHYVKNAELAEQNGYEGDLQLTNPEVLWQDNIVNEIPTAGMKTLTVSGIRNGTTANNISGQVFRVNCQIVKPAGAYGNTLHMADAEDPSITIACYSQSSGSDYAWLQDYLDGQNHEFAVAVYDNNYSANSAVKYRAVPLLAL